MFLLTKKWIHSNYSEVSRDSCVLDTSRLWPRTIKLNVSTPHRQQRFRVDLPSVAKDFMDTIEFCLDVI